ncbi:MAG TPA: bifunctional chorismate mutase/prephenate dehydrogenase [Succinivibrionaceae bacterium]|nr:bifunctional chorismate mutase/prephenate dehydrogenase [Succinivibrionaceae bacterium]
MPVSDLSALRTQIDETDEKIIKLLAERAELVKQAVAAKKENKTAAYSKERESYLLTSRREMAKKYGVPEGLASDILKRILRESYHGGEGRYARLMKTPGDVVIVGGNGGMGSIFKRYFENSGYQVFCFGHRGWDRAPEYLKNARIVIVTVPIDITVQVIEQLSPLLRDDMILCDFTSVKVPIVEAMLRCHKGPVLGLHPMFGPDVKSLVKQVIVTVPARDEEASRFLVEQFSLWGATIVNTKASEHDRAMRIIQALRHFTTYCYGLFMASIGQDLHTLLELSSPIYRMELMMVGRLFAQDPRLYADIIMSSKENYELLASYVESLREELSVIADKDVEGFTQRFLKAREYFGDDADSFLKESGAILAKLQDERVKEC